MSSEDLRQVQGPQHYNTEEFVFRFKQSGKHHVLKVPIPIPLTTTVREFAYRIIGCHSISCYVENELINKLRNFVTLKTKELRKCFGNNAVNGVKEKPELIDNLLDSWTNAYFKEHTEYQIQNGRDAENIEFANVYHELIHSPALETLLQLEHNYSVAVGEMLEQRNISLEKLHQKHEHDMSYLIENIGTSYTDMDVNDLSTRHLEEYQIQETYWSSSLSDLQEMQKRDYREWVRSVHDNTIANSGKIDLGDFTAYAKQNSFTETSDPAKPHYDFVHQDAIKMEESFTIHLGHQMKTMHNIRILCGDILSLCRHTAAFIGGNLVPQPRRLQTAMSLYSQSLSALVLLVDNRLQSQMGIKKEFRNICMQSTDFHFADLDKQLSAIEVKLEQRPSRTRTIRSSSVLHKIGSDQQHTPATTTSLLQTGDFYLTKHSNLAEVHTIFHLVTDDSVLKNNITSRHPIIIGLRNILLSAATHNITTLTIPLLLVHEMTENFTIQWCVRRAELILKCVKGFMMEGLCWEGDDSRTIQFIVPEGISDDMFTTFTSMLPNIFRVSTPLDLSSLAQD
eukprot:gene15610-17183_t